MKKLAEKKQSFVLKAEHCYPPMFERFFVLFENEKNKFYYFCIGECMRGGKRVKE